MACDKHPKYAGVRLSKKAEQCDGCKAFNKEVNAAFPGGKEKRNSKAKKVDDLVITTPPATEVAAVLGEVFSDPVEEKEVFKPVDEVE